MTFPDHTLPSLLTVDEVARTFRVSRRTVDRWLRRGRIGSCKIGGRRLVPSSEVARLAAARYVSETLVATTEGGTP